MISIRLNLLKFVLWPITCCVLLNSPSVLEKNAHSGAFWCSILKMSIRTHSLIVLLKRSISLRLLVYLFYHLLEENGTIKYLSHLLSILKFTSSDINNHSKFPVMRFVIVYFLPSF